MNKEQIVNWRTDRGINQTVLAELAGISSSYLSSLESGYYGITRKVDRKLSRAMALYDEEIERESAPVQKVYEDDEWVSQTAEALRELEKLQFENEQREEKRVELERLTEEARHAPGRIVRTEPEPTPVDGRYNKPKAIPNVPLHEVEALIRKNEIYRRVGSMLHSAQRKQVAYGMEKYPEPLNAETWSHIETIDHIIEESIDKLHYLVMLRIKLEQDNIHREES